MIYYTAMQVRPFVQSFRPGCSTVGDCRIHCPGNVSADTCPGVTTRRPRTLYESKMYSHCVTNTRGASVSPPLATAVRVLCELYINSHW